jgi:hypothetical protein
MNRYSKEAVKHFKVMEQRAAKRETLDCVCPIEAEMEAIEVYECHFCGKTMECKGDVFIVPTYSTKKAQMSCCLCSSHRAKRYRKFALHSGPCCYVKENKSGTPTSSYDAEAVLARLKELENKVENLMKLCSED